MNAIRLSLKSLPVIVLALVLLKIVNPIWSNINWGLSSSIVIITILIIMLFTFEKRKHSLNYLVMIATVSSFAAVGRIIFTGIASVQPMTFIVMITGYTWGSRSGFLIGMIGAFVSNLYLGQGPWTPWQMMGWGLCGLLAGLLGKRQNTFRLIPFLILAFLGGLFFGLIMNIWHWLAFTFPLRWQTLIAVLAGSFPLDIFHAVSNVIFTIILGRPFYNVLY
ncbi:MAG: ECF transporter S component, partial [Syntrophomonadaceae bacterium]|nr:ECF transporter S component [Syntrophomonadaceae bacterium]